jgi:hypothetical protein
VDCALPTTGPVPATDCDAYRTIVVVVVVVVAVVDDDEVDECVLFFLSFTNDTQKVSSVFCWVGTFCRTKQISASLASTQTSN